MAQELKENPHKLKADAKLRVSKQCGRSVTDINKLLSRYEVSTIYIYNIYIYMH